MAALETNRALSGNFLRYTKQLASYPIFRATTLRSLPFGTCMESCTCPCWRCEAKEIPVAIDFTPQWANRKYGHYWLTVLNMRHRSEQFAPFDIEPDAHLNRPFSKIYRMTYRPNPELAERLFRKETIPSSLQYIFFFGMSATNTCAPTISTSRSSTISTSATISIFRPSTIRNGSP